MRILILSQWFQPEPLFKGLPLATALRDRGHDVEVLTGFPNYPGGRLYPGYRLRAWQRETMQGVRVNRVPLFPSHDRSGGRRMLNYLSFGASAALLGPWLVQKPDLIYVYNLISLGMAAGLLRRIQGGRIVLDVQDLWPESVTSSGMLRGRWMLAALESWCRYEYRRPNQLVVLSPGFKQHLASRGVDEHRIEVIYNWCDETAIAMPEPSSQEASRYGFAGRFNVIFAGTMGAVQGLATVVEAAKNLQSRAPQVLFTFVGGGVDVEPLKRAAAGLTNVQFLPQRPPAEIGQILTHADALLVHLKRDPLFAMTIPSKIQAYLFAGKPILCGVSGDAADLVQRAGAGRAFTPEDPAALAEAVVVLTRMEPAERRAMGDSGRRYYDEHLSFHCGVARMEQLFQRVVATTRG